MWVYDEGRGKCYIRGWREITDVWLRGCRNACAGSEEARKKVIAAGVCNQNKLKPMPIIASRTLTPLKIRFRVVRKLI